MRPEAIIDSVSRLGGHLTVDGSDILCAAPAPLPDDLLSELRRHKPELIRFICDHGSDPRHREVSCGGVPDAWLQGIAIMTEMPAPCDWPADKWPHTIETVAWFLERWGATAAALGWGTLDLFGAHPRAPYARHDYIGLALSDWADRISVMTETEARFHRGASDLGRLRKQMPPDAAPIWALAKEG